MSEIPEDIINQAEKTISGLLPQKSKAIYEQAYNEFIKWKNAKGANIIEENIVLVYFSELAEKKTRGNLWPVFSMLKSTILVHNNVDISKFEKVRSFLKRTILLWAFESIVAEV